MITVACELTEIYLASSEAHAHRFWACREAIQVITTKMNYNDGWTCIDNILYN